MKATLRLECIEPAVSPKHRMWMRVLDGLAGEGNSMPRRYWVAEITGADPKYKFRRRFLPCHKDYSKANSLGTRGVYAYYILDEGALYEVSEPVSWKRTERYFCRISHGDIIRMGEEDVLAWLRDHSASTSTTQPESE